MTGDTKTEDKKRDDTLKRMLGTPPKPHVNESATKPTTRKKGDDESGSRRRPAAKKVTSSQA